MLGPARASLFRRFTDAKKHTEPVPLKYGKNRHKIYFYSAQGVVKSDHLWSRYDLHVVGKHRVLCECMKCDTDKNKILYPSFVWRRQLLH